MKLLLSSGAISILVLFTTLLMVAVKAEKECVRFDEKNPACEKEKCGPRDPGRFIPDGLFYPFGKCFDIPLIDLPKYILFKDDETLGLFIHRLSKPMPVFHRKELYMFMSVNGYISFDKPVQHPQAVNIPTNFGIPMISVFHQDLRFTTHPRSHFSFFEYTYDWANPNENPVSGLIMEQALQDLSYNIPDLHFYPTQAVVVTWSNAFKEIGRGRSTFQLVLVSDGVNTYLITNYKQISLRGVLLNRRNFCPVTIGWDEATKAKNTPGFFRHRFMQLAPRRNPRGLPPFIYDPFKMSRRTNVDIRGKWIYHIAGPKAEGVRPPTPDGKPHPHPGVKLPAQCPGKKFCRGRRRLLPFPKHPGFFVVCNGNDTPQCMPCPKGTVFSRKCAVCIHSQQREISEQNCRRRGAKGIHKKERQTFVCNHRDARNFCQAHGKNTMGHFLNYNDITRRTYYQCAGIFGSWCRRCADGTLFMNLDTKNEAYGLCIHADTVKTLIKKKNDWLAVTDL